MRANNHLHPFTLQKALRSILEMYNHTIRLLHQIHNPLKLSLLRDVYHIQQFLQLQDLLDHVKTQVMATNTLYLVHFDRAIA